MKNISAKLALLIGLSFVASVGLAHADDRDVVRDSEGQIVHSSNGNCVRTQWSACTDQCGAAPQQATRQAVAELTQEDRTIYFPFNKATLTPAAKRRLDTLANVLSSNDRVQEAKVVGYADRIGSVSYNDKLSQKRAEAVRAYLVSRGYTKSRVTETRWFGKSVPATHCPAKLARPKLIQCLQRDRRVEVEIVYQADGSGQ
ncbi:MAG: OmpA family protein [Pseudomonadota bacterium]|nr:OmpA family protein [Pseudomonadota bacterium]